MKASLVNFLLQAETPLPEPAYPGLLGRLSALEQFLFFAILVVFFLGCWAILHLSFTLMEIQRARLLKDYSPELLREVGLERLAPREAWWQRLFEKLTDRIPIEEEGAIVLDHEYDGIHELDNNLPPWWKGLFYASIVFAPIYLYLNHFASFSTSSAEEYELAMERADEMVDAYLATQANAVDETNVTLLTDVESLNTGELIFKNKCAVCHGTMGEGTIGPNLTDDYWIHGGDIKDVFRTIKYGVPAKGMIAWKNDLRASDMQAVASYIKELYGTEPPNPKEPQGELYTPEIIE